MNSTSRNGRDRSKWSPRKSGCSCESLSTTWMKMRFHCTHFQHFVCSACCNTSIDVSVNQSINQSISRSNQVCLHCIIMMHGESAAAGQFTLKISVFWSIVGCGLIGLRTWATTFLTLCRIIWISFQKLRQVSCGMIFFIKTIHRVGTLSHSVHVYNGVWCFCVLWWFRRK